MNELGYTHRFVAATTPGLPTLLLLHGTGGNEDDLVPLGQELLPGAALLSPRGNVLERGMPRFFRRLTEGVFDLDDLRRRSAELAAFIAAAAERYGLDRERVIAVGYSNGANIAASLLLLHPAALSGAVLLRAMVPLIPDALPSLPGTPVLLSAGEHDPIVPRRSVEELAAMLTAAGAAVTTSWQPTGHGLTSADMAVASDWLAERVTTAS